MVTIRAAKLHKRSDGADVAGIDSWIQRLLFAPPNDSVKKFSCSCTEHWKAICPSKPINLITSVSFHPLNIIFTRISNIILIIAVSSIGQGSNSSNNALIASSSVLSLARCTGLVLDSASFEVTLATKLHCPSITFKSIINLSTSFQIVSCSAGTGINRWRDFVQGSSADARTDTFDIPRYLPLWWQRAVEKTSSVLSKYLFLKSSKSFLARLITGMDFVLSCAVVS